MANRAAAFIARGAPSSSRPRLPSSEQLAAYRAADESEQEPTGVIRLVVVLLVLAVAPVACAAHWSDTPLAGPTLCHATVTGASGAREPHLWHHGLLPRAMRAGIAACDLLTADQQAALGRRSSNADHRLCRGAARCQWRTRDRHRRRSTVTSATDFPVGGLEGLYLVRGTYDVFEPGELDGLPDSACGPCGHR